MSSSVLHSISDAIGAAGKKIDDAAHNLLDPQDKSNSSHSSSSSSGTASARPSMTAEQVRSQYASAIAGKRILVTGGVGYIGSHTVLELVLSGAIVTVVDNLSNANLECLRRVEKLTSTTIEFVKADLRDKPLLEQLLFANRPAYDAVIHFAGLKAVGESVSIPLKYWDHNVCGCVALLQLMDAYACRSIVFSSSATVYGMVASNPILESFPLSTTNPYGSTKLTIENILREVAASPAPAAPARPWNIAILRYFNPIGAHNSGLIGEDPAGIPNNLLPFVLQAAVGRRDQVTVFGDDWGTPDGTGVRDYIHVVDLSIGHLAALSDSVFKHSIGSGGGNRCEAYNLGTGRGVSVLEIIKATEAASGRTIKYKVGPRRPGDIAECYSDPAKAEKELRWRATYTLEEAVADSWRWQEKNPQGFGSSSSSS